MVRDYQFGGKVGWFAFLGDFFEVLKGRGGVHQFVEEASHMNCLLLRCPMLWPSCICI
jgi:hypothetical protein